MKIDLHTHSDIGSKCSVQSVRHLVEGAILSGLDAVCITDHNNLMAAETAAQVSAELRFPVFVGMEVSIDEGDIVAFGPLASEGYALKNYADFRKALDIERTALFAAHPYRGGAPFGRIADTLRRYRGDFCALEAYSLNMTPFDSRMTLALADELGLKCLANSDSHAHCTPPGHYFTEFDRTIRTIEDLVRALKEGAFQHNPNPSTNSPFTAI